MRHADRHAGAPRWAAAQFAYHLGVLLGPHGRGYCPADIEGLSAFEAAFFRRLYQLVWDHRFGGPEGRRDEEEREADLVYVGITLPAVIAELSCDHEALGVVKQIQGALERRASGMTRAE